MRCSSKRRAASLEKEMTTQHPSIDQMKDVEVYPECTTLDMPDQRQMALTNNGRVRQQSMIKANAFLTRRPDLTHEQFSSIGSGEPSTSWR